MQELDKKDGHKDEPRTEQEAEDAPAKGDYAPAGGETYGGTAQQDNDGGSLQSAASRVEPGEGYAHIAREVRGQVNRAPGVLLRLEERLQEERGCYGANPRQRHQTGDGDATGPWLQQSTAFRLEQQVP